MSHVQVPKSRRARRVAAQRIEVIGQPHATTVEHERVVHEQLHFGKIVRRDHGRVCLVVIDRE
ncbi:MAG: hypothetical protein H7099_05560 [Gemmatimonadaceae bacterium]|nr:hypothetical protein [Gemmatimonadaceae bacterium]